jgi:hypothetical protein
MSVFKTTFSRGLRLFPSDNAIIPNPALFVSIGATTSFEDSFLLIDDNADFLNQKVYPGDVVYSDNSSATVVAVQSATELALNASIIIGADQDYTIYGMSPQANIGNPGCYLYIGGTGNVSVITIGGDQITFNGIPAGTTLPIQVRQLLASGTTATLINGLW